MPDALVCTMEMNKADTMLFTADSAGFVYVWNIEGYSMHGFEDDPPECKFIQIKWNIVHRW